MKSALVKIIFMVFGLGFLSIGPAFAQQVSGQISRVGDATHLEFSGRTEWNYDDPVKDGDKLTFVLPAFDELTETRLRSWSCPFVKEVQINKSGPDGKYAVTFVVNDKSVESFDYQTDEPSHLVIDFYKRTAEDGPAPVAQTAASGDAKAAGAKSSTKSQANNSGGLTGKKARTDYTKADGRSPASDEILVGPGVGNMVVAEKPANQFPTIGVFDGSDPNYDRFNLKEYEVKEDAIIASQQNIYIKFPMLKMKTDHFAEMMKTTPAYEITPKEDRENKEARFIIALHLKQRTGSFYETYEYFMKKYPDSPYDEIMRNMKAEQGAQRYLEKGDPVDYEQFRSEYKYLLQKYPDSVLAERNLLLLGYSALYRGDGAEALQNLERYLQKYPTSSERDSVRLAMADGYISLYKPADALRLYAEIEKDPVEKTSAVEATYRRGDVYFGQSKYKDAAEAYQSALKKYPAHARILPNAPYNLAESQFWMGEYRKSLQGFIDYLKMYPAHPHGGFALTRIGELLQILGADQTRVTGAFIEGYFRFPTSQGSEVSRIRMLAQGFKGMKEKEKEKALKEIEDISAKSTLPRMDEFVTLVICDGFTRRNEHTASLEKLVNYYREHPVVSNQDVFRSRILRNISDIMKQELLKGDFMNAMNVHGKYAKTWLRNSTRIDIPYYRARAYEESGVYKEAQKNYAQLRGQLEKMVGTKEYKKRRVYENLPTIDQLNLRMAAVALEEKQYQEALSQLQKIKLPLSPEENIERVQIGARVAELVGNYDQAIQYLKEQVATWNGQEELLVQPYVNLAGLSLKTAKFDEAEEYLQKIEDMHSKSKVVDETWAKTLELKAETQFEKGKKIAAVETYVTLLDQFENKRPMSSIRYRAGKILFDEGDLKGAQKLWAALPEKGGEFYKKLAEEKLKQASFADSYKKYIDRIPAAADL